MADETVPITNELLCFIQNEIDVIPYEMVVKLTSNFHDDVRKDQGYNMVS